MLGFQNFFFPYWSYVHNETWLWYSIISKILLYFGVYGSQFFLIKVVGANPIAIEKSLIVFKVLMNGTLSVLVRVWWDGCLDIFFFKYFTTPSFLLPHQVCRCLCWWIVSWVPTPNLMGLSFLMSRGIVAVEQL